MQGSTRRAFCLCLLWAAACAGAKTPSVGGALGGRDDRGTTSEVRDAVDVPSEVGERVDDLQKLTVEATAIEEDFVYKIDGPGAIFLIRTPEGAVLVDTGFDNEQSIAQQALARERPHREDHRHPRHPDHAGGLPHWREAIDSGRTEFVAHHRYGYMSRLQAEPLPYLKRRFHVLYPTLVDPESVEDRVWRAERVRTPAE
jgi:glyoxylase-like metal-dependent hydrolase (beta-lactamase superfamily II)